MAGAWNAMPIRWRLQVPPSLWAQVPNHLRQLLRTAIQNDAFQHFGGPVAIPVALQGSRIVLPGQNFNVFYQMVNVEGGQAIQVDWIT